VLAVDEDDRNVMSVKSLNNLARFFAAHPLTRKAPLKAWLRFAAWQVKCRLTDEVVVDWIEGQKLAVRRGMVGATGNLYTGLHEFSDMMVPLHFLRQGDLFIDVGANIGSFTVLASGICGASTWAFEPDPDTARALRRNVEVNALESLVSVHEAALGASDGEISFTVGLDSMNRVAPEGIGRVRFVRQHRLDDLVGEGHPIMLKLDIEGYEEQALAGATRLLEAPGLKVIEIETLTPDSIEQLTRNGFEKFYYDPFTRKLDRNEIGPRASNALYVRDKDFVSARLAAGRKVHVLDWAI
jgi:FkbM family methyltransferase